MYWDYYVLFDLIWGKQHLTDPAWVVQQDYERLEDGTRIKTKDDAIIEFRIMPATQGLYARRMTTYDKFTFTPPDDLSVYDFEGREKVEVDAQAKPEEFWVDNRHVPVKKKENAGMSSEI